MPSPWLDDKAVNLSVGNLSIEELLEVWANHRNDLTGVMAAEEVMKRLYAERKLLEVT